jgi:hypothetical protein
MNITPLKDLHNQLMTAYSSEKCYLNNNLTGQLKADFLKKTKMTDVFKTAKEQIEKTLQNTKPLLVLKNSDQENCLAQLKEDGKLLYTRYIKQTNTWSRRLIKVLFRLTPQFIASRLLPNYSQIEKATKTSYENYKNYLNKILNEEKVFNSLNQCIQDLDLLKTQPHNLVVFKKILEQKLLEAFDQCAQLESFSSHWLEAKNILQDIYFLYENRQALSQALDTNQDKDLVQLLQKTQWNIVLSERSITLGLRNQNMWVLSESGMAIRENALQNYDGKLVINLPKQPFALLQKLNKLVDDPARCLHPHLLIFNCQNLNLTSEEFDLIFKLNQKISTIELKEIKLIDFNTLKLTAEKVQIFNSQFRKIKCPDLIEVRLGYSLDQKATMDTLFLLKTHFPLLTTIDLSFGNSLTTDCLFELIKFEQLTDCKLPQLQQGSKDINQLPPFSDPLKIKQFYLASPETAHLANQLYQGIFTAAFTFQIPLAQKIRSESSESIITQLSLDPTTVSAWLDNNNFELLAKQPAVKTVFADGQFALTDKNLLPFVSKFPNASFLSLCYLSHVTTQGLIDLLAQHPTIKKLDITGCEGIDPDQLRQSHLHLIVIRDEQKKIISENELETFHQRLNPLNALPWTINFERNKTDSSGSLSLYPSLLYCLSDLLRRALQPGGDLTHPTVPPIQNQNATEDAVKALGPLLNNQSFDPSISWQTAASLAELVGEKCLGLAPSIRESLLEFIQNSLLGDFNSEEIDAKLLAFRKLESLYSIQFCEEILINQFRVNSELLPELSILARTHSLNDLTSELNNFTIQQYS